MRAGIGARTGSWSGAGLRDPLPASGRSDGPAAAGAVVLNGRSGGGRGAGGGRPALARGAHITPPLERGVPRQLAGCGTWRC